jgi:hypothetical protein
MTTAMLKTNLVAQTQGTSPKTTTTQTQKTGDVQSAARDLRDAITTQINAEAIRARAQAAAARATAVQVEGAQNPSTPPARAGRTFTIRTPDGETVVGVPPQFGRDVIPPQAVDITIAFFITVAVIIIGLPLARAFARRMDRRSSPGQVPAEISSQLSHLNQAVDAIALEVERISEGQRFTARLLSEQRDAPRQTLSSGVDR